MFATREITIPKHALRYKHVILKCARKSFIRLLWLGFLIINENKIIEKVD